MNSNQNCPVCGALTLYRPPYFEYRPELLPQVRFLPGPYSRFFGAESFDCCACCGFEFGFDDHPGASDNARSFDQYLLDWIEAGSLWFAPERKPKDWDLQAQLSNAGIVDPRIDNQKKPG